MNKLKSFINTKPVQWVMLVLWIIVVLAVFIPHFVVHTQTYVDKRNIVRCRNPRATHRVEISEKGFNPEKLIANTCDQIIFVNTGSKFREPAFGPHESHLIYPGYEEELLKSGETNNFVLTAFGDYQLHDHIYNELTMQLQVRALGTTSGQN